LRRKENGEVEVEEFKIDANGKKITKNIKVEIDDDGYECQIEEEVAADGSKKFKKKKIIVDEKGNDVEVIETTDENGNKIIKVIN
jgi:hypothetical protein